MAADLVLGHAAEREADGGELGGGHGEQEVGLVLAGVAAAPELVAGAARDDLRVVAGDEEVGADRAGAREQRRELDVLVALDARVGGLAGEVGLDEVVDDGGAELGGEIDDVVRDAEVGAHGARVLDVARAAAPAAGGRGGAPGVVQPHGHPDDLVALLDEDGRRGGAVDAAGQRGHDERARGAVGRRRAIAGGDAGHGLRRWRRL